MELQPELSSVSLLPPLSGRSVPSGAAGTGVLWHGGVPRGMTEHGGAWGEDVLREGSTAALPSSAGAPWAFFGSYLALFSVI